MPLGLKGKVMKILAIGNSFSQDFFRYLSAVARAEGVRIDTLNLYIGGCSLRTHYINMLDDRFDYSAEFNGATTYLKTSIGAALKSADWDIVSLQQVSNLSPKFDSYTPYIEALAEYVKKCCPKAKIYIHQTWAYEEGSKRLIEEMKFEHSVQMYEKLADAYDKAATAVNAVGIVRSGEAMIKAQELGLKLHRDTYHASLGVGRYLLALNWYKTLTGRDITNNCFNAFDEAVSDEERALVIKAVNSLK